jgi:hypothetical protein
MLPTLIVSQLFGTFVVELLANTIKICLFLFYLSPAVSLLPFNAQTVVPISAIEEINYTLLRLHFNGRNVCLTQHTLHARNGSGGGGGDRL